MIGEISNPSDPYTMECDDFLVGCVAVAIVGNGKCGFSVGEQSSPVLFGWDGWIEEHISQGLESFIEANKSAIADALASVRIGSLGGREVERLAENHMTPEQIEEYRAKRHDIVRTSMNDIGTRAWAMADELRRQLGDAPAATGVVANEM